MVNEAFKRHISTLSRNELHDFLHRLDEEKREIRRRLDKSRRSSAQRLAHDEHARLFDRLREALEERKYVHRMLGVRGEQRAALNRATNGRAPELNEAFVAVAELQLDPATFARFEEEARRILGLE